jgi:hypothetical protein
MISIKKFQDFLINENAEEAEALIKRKIDQIEQKLKELFTSDEIKGGEIQKIGDVESKQKSDVFANLNLESLEKSQFSKTSKSIKLIFSDDEFRYDAIFKINLEDVVPAEGQEVDPESLKECEVEFKRYSLEEGSEPKGDTTKKVNIDEINEGTFEDLLLDLEKDFPSKEEPGEEFSIETE